MPKIRKLDIPFGVTHIEAELHYNAKHNFHIKGLPPEFEEQTGFSNTATTEAALVTEVCEKARILAAAQTTEAFFIDVSFAVGASIGHRHDFFDMPLNYQDTVPKAFVGSHFSRPTGYGFSLSHSIVCKVKVLDSEQLYSAQFRHDTKEIFRTSTKIHRSTGLLVPYTPERLKFFEQMEKAAGRMAFKIADFFHQNSDNIGPVLDSILPGQLLAENESERPE